MGLDRVLDAAALTNGAARDMGWAELAFRCVLVDRAADTVRYVAMDVGAHTLLVDLRGYRCAPLDPHAAYLPERIARLCPGDHNNNNMRPTSEVQFYLGGMQAEFEGAEGCDPLLCDLDPLTERVLTDVANNVAHEFADRVTPDDRPQAIDSFHRSALDWSGARVRQTSGPGSWAHLGPALGLGHVLEQLWRQPVTVQRMVRLGVWGSASTLAVLASTGRAEVWTVQGHAHANQGTGLGFGGKGRTLVFSVDLESFLGHAPPPPRGGGASSGSGSGSGTGAYHWGAQLDALSGLHQQWLRSLHHATWPGVLQRVGDLSKRLVAASERYPMDHVCAEWASAQGLGAQMEETQRTLGQGLASTVNARLNGRFHGVNVHMWRPSDPLPRQAADDPDVRMYQEYRRGVAANLAELQEGVMVPLHHVGLLAAMSFADLSLQVTHLLQRTEHRFRALDRLLDRLLPVDTGDQALDTPGADTGWMGETARQTHGRLSTARDAFEALRRDPQRAVLARQERVRVIGRDRERGGGFGPREESVSSSSSSDDSSPDRDDSAGKERYEAEGRDMSEEEEEEEGEGKERSEEEEDNHDRYESESYAVLDDDGN